MLHVGFGNVKTLAIRNKLISKLYQLSGYAVTPAAYRILCVRFVRLVHQSPDSATDATLDTGGWLALTRPGLSPGKMRQAYLGAITSPLSGRASGRSPLAKIRLEWLVSPLLEARCRAARHSWPQSAVGSKITSIGVSEKEWAIVIRAYSIPSPSFFRIKSGDASTRPIS